MVPNGSYGYNVPNSFDEYSNTKWLPRVTIGPLVQILTMVPVVTKSSNVSSVSKSSNSYSGSPRLQWFATVTMVTMVAEA